MQLLLIPFIPEVPPQSLSFKAGVCDIWGLMPDDLRWSWCNNNRKKIHNKCNDLEPSRNHPTLLVHGKIIFHRTSLWCQKGLGITAFRDRLDLQYGGLACCDSWGRKESDTTERLNWTISSCPPSVLRCYGSCGEGTGGPICVSSHFI